MERAKKKEEEENKKSPKTTDGALFPVLMGNFRCPATLRSNLSVSRSPFLQCSLPPSFFFHFVCFSLAPPIYTGLCHTLPQSSQLLWVPLPLFVWISRTLCLNLSVFHSIPVSNINGFGWRHLPQTCRNADVCLLYSFSHPSLGLGNLLWLSACLCLHPSLLSPSLTLSLYLWLLLSFMPNSFIKARINNLISFPAHSLRC